MGTEIAVPSLLNKLRELCADDVIITYPKFSYEVVRLIEKLELFPVFSEDEVGEILRSVAGLLINRAEDIIDAFILRTEVQRRKRTNRLLSRFNQKNSTHQLHSIISELCRMLEMSGRLSNRRLSDQIFPTIRWENIPRYLDEASYIVAREKEIDELAMRLLDYEEKTRNSRVIAVLGHDGSGKTTLVRKVYNRVDIKHHFECRAWVHFSEELVKNSSLAEKQSMLMILKQVMVMTKEQRLSNEELKLRLRTFLENKRYLIVFDIECRIRNWIIWETLMQALPNTENGSKIILATRDGEIAHISDEERSPFMPRLLTDEESWALFLNKIRVSEDDSRMPDFIHVREQILRTCNGNPSEILLLGGLLSTINSTEWSRVIGDATSSDKYQGILALSYQRLPYELKSCLLYMCLFPKEYEIPVRRLFGLWIAENMVTPLLAEGRVVEDVAQTYFNELVGRNMIEVAKWRSDGRPKACRMAHVRHDFILHEAQNTGFLHVNGIPGYRISAEKQSIVKRWGYYLDSEGYPSDRDNIRSLRSYVSSDTRMRGMPAVGIGMLLIKITGKRGFGLLVVLDLEGVYKPVLPKALGKLLVLLRYLGLRSTVLDSLPASVGELQRLETLDVKDTNLTNLPSSILKGKKIRHLYLNGINLDMSIVQQSIETVGDLQTLSGISIGSEGSIENGLNRFTGLRKLGLTCYSTAMEAAASWISQLTNLRTLKLRSINTTGRPSELRFEQMMRHHNKLSHLYLLGVLPNLGELLPPNLEILTLSLSSLGEDPMPVLGGLHQLKTLRLLAKSYRGKLLNCSRGSFPQLRILKLWMLEELEEWRMEEGAMPCLRELEIRRCDKLKKPDGLEHLATLKELILTNMPEVFVTDLKRSTRRDLFININNWEFSASA